jgi:virginiamycin A acetyltransferase
MKVFEYLKSLSANLINFVKTAVKYQFHWDQYASKQEHCEISSKSNIDKLHFLLHVKVGFGTAIGPNARISYTDIGKFCSLGPNLICGWGIHPLNGISTSPAFYSTRNQAGFSYSKTDKIAERKPIVIGNDVFIGANVTILDGVTIGDGAVIGAGAVVSKNIPPYAIAIGIPITVVKYRFSNDIIEKLLNTRWWDKDETTYKLVEEYFYDIEGFLNTFNTKQGKKE